MSAPTNAVAAHNKIKVMWLAEVAVTRMIFVSWLAHISQIAARDHTPPISL